MEIVRKYLTPDEISSPDIRWNETTDEIEYSPDGGATWVPAPGLDPRHEDIFRMPPLSGATAQCDAAANMVATVRASVNTLVTNGNLVAVASPMLDLWLIAIGTVNPLIALIIIAIEALLAIGVTVIDAAFTEGVYDDLLCIFYCNIGADGQVSAAQFADILTAIDGLDTVVNATMDIFFNVWGEVGLSNAGATGTETGDCGACDCGPWCWEWTEAEIYAALSWTVDEYIVGEYTVVDANSAFTATITDAEFDFEYRPNEGSTYDDGGGSIYDEEFPINPIASNAPAAPPGGTVVFHDAAGFAITELHMYSNSDFTGGSNYPLITRIRITGLSPRPGFANGSACV